MPSSSSLPAAPLVAALLSLALAAGPASAAYSATSLLLVRVAGSGSAPVCPSNDAACSRAAELFLDEYVPSADGSTAALASSTPLSGVTLSATDYYQGSLNLCADGTCAALAATAAPAGAVPSLGAPYFADHRVIVRVAANGSVDTSTRIAAGDYPGMIKGVCSFDGSGYFIVGNATTSCVSYARHGAAPGVGGGGAPGSFVNVAKGANCATAQGAMEGAYTSCVATAASQPGKASFNRTLLFSRVFSDYALVDAVQAPEAAWTQPGGLQLLGTTTDVLDNGFSNAWYFSQITASRSQDLFFLTDPYGGTCEIDICRGKDAFPTQAAWTGKSGCGVHVSYLTMCAYSGVTFSLDEKLIYFTSRNRLVSYPVAGGAGKILVTLPAGQEFRGVSRAPFVCGGAGAVVNGSGTGGGVSGPVGSPVAGFYCPNGAGSSILPCPAGTWSLAGATTTCTAPLPSPTPSPSPAGTPSVTPSASFVAPGAPCWAASTFAGPDFITPNIPTGVAFNAATKVLHVADVRMHEVVQVSAGGVASTFVGSSGERGYLDGVGTNARFRSPQGLALHELTGDLYVADSYFALIRRVTPLGVVSTLLGAARQNGGGAVLDGDATTARFSLPSSLAIDSAGDVLYVMDAGGAALRAVHNLRGAISVSTIAGSGIAGAPLNSLVGTSARFSASTLGGIALDAPRGLLYVGDFNNNAVRMVNLSSSAVSTIAGGRVGILDGVGTNAEMWLPAGVALSPKGDVLYVAEWQNAIVRKVAVGTPGVAASVSVSVLAGDTDLSDGVAEGAGVSAKLPWPTHLAVDRSSGALFATMYFHASVVKITPSDSAAAVVKFVVSPASAAVDGTGYNSRFSAITAIAVDPATDNLIVVDHGAHRIRKVSPLGVTTTLAGGALDFKDGPLSSARFNKPTGVAVSADGAQIFVSDTGNRLIRVISTKLGTVDTLAGTNSLPPAVVDGEAKKAVFSMPCQIATFGGAVFVLDSINAAYKPGGLPIKFGDSLRKVADGRVTTIASSSGARFFNFAGAMSPIVVDLEGRVTFGDFWNNRFMQYTPATGVVYGGAISLPMGMAIDASAGGAFAGSVVMTGGAWEARRVNRTTFASLGAAFGDFNVGSMDGIFGNLTYDEGVAAMQPGAMAFDSKGHAFVAHTFHNKIMRVGKLIGDACSLATDPNLPAHRCHPGTFIDWPAQTCRPCSTLASTYVFPFSSYCQDANGRVIGSDAQPIDVAAVAGVSVGGIAAGVIVVLALLAVRAYHVVNKKGRTKPKQQLQQRRASGGGGGRVVVEQTPNPLNGLGPGGGGGGSRRIGGARGPGTQV